MDKIIDIHTHIGKLRFKERGLSAYTLVKTMDKWGISKAVVLPIENPEELDFYVTTKEVLKECKKYPDRLIPFCNVDPRHRYKGQFEPYDIIKMYKEEGCKGFGEHLAGLPVDSYQNQKIYEACGKLKMPILMHFDKWINRDKDGLINFEEMLKKFSDTVFIAHGPCFWMEISGDVDKKDRRKICPYPKGEIKKKGRVDFLLSKYKNLYGDLSAGSGYNAITRDINFGLKFLERNKNKLLFGTDYLSPNQDVRIVEFFKHIKISSSAFKLITYSNAAKLLRL
jgi:predicted TIM-barrel fold metal-dependent hydrolase